MWAQIVSIGVKSRNPRSFFAGETRIMYNYFISMCCKLEGVVSIEFIPTNHQETFKVRTGVALRCWNFQSAPPPGVSTPEGQNWKLQFPGMKLVLERWNGACF